ncbi:hybrid sensor histidine kinase/response regulator [Cystobacter ferrugineus]|uniref:histidine kinase n=1 Tax=Cystobacter ferrugineus TaxID=83449 RepID=A0A1L9BKS5_9BACT|nr:hybrid sensor histidine kinase/response regulator [Cystobacter ferrugineus]
MAAPLPDNEQERLAALRSYAVLDTEPELSFDDVTHLASRLCGTPMALVVLVDEARQWFKSRQGMDIEECSREEGFCAHTILQREPLVIQDATADARFRGNPFVAAPSGIRFYAGAPLINPQGHALGSICVLDYTPRQLTPEQTRSLEALARQVVSLLELRRMNCEQRRLIAELRTSQERIDILQRATHDAIWDWDLKTNQLTWNPRLAELLGDELEHARSDISWWFARFHPGDRARVKDSLDRAIAQGASMWTDEYRFRLANGTWARMFSRCAIQRDAEGHPLRLIGVSLDISEREALRARVALAERMSSVGTLAAGVAHEINNPLAYVMANLNYALTEVREGRAGAPDADELTQVLQEAHEGAERIRRIVRDLKTFSRPADERMEWLDLHHTIDSAVTLAWNELRHRARLVKQYQEVPRVYANEGRLGQVVLHLLMNAAHAIPEGAADQNEIRITTRVDAEGRVLIEVSDTGRGIPEAIRSRIFEPFFTTQPVGEGMGLGLSINHTLVTHMGGELQFESEVDKGTVFRVVLPPPERLAPESAPPREPVPPPAEVAATRRGRLLVVDDEARVLSSLERTLGRTHEVITFERAQAALAWLEQGQPWDLILCDVMMPEMTGMEFHAALAQRMPERVRDIIFITGGAFTATAREFLARVDNARLDKPFDLQALRALVEARLKEVNPVRESPPSRDGAARG